MGNGGEGGGEPGPCADVYSTSQVNVGKQKTATMKISHTKNAKGEDLEGEEEEGAKSWWRWTMTEEEEKDLPRMRRVVGASG